MDQERQDRLLVILRWVVAPIIIAVITGYYELRVSTAKEQAKAQTKASYETLAPNVLELQEKVAVLTGRLDEVSKRPPCPELPARGMSGSIRHAPPVGLAKPGGVGVAGSAGIAGTLGYGKTEVTVDLPSAPNEPAPTTKKVPARFDDMIQQQAK